jgi:rsbT co-antagonist protein RsbR
VIRLDANGWVCSWHPGAERLTQYTVGEIIGMPASVFYVDEECSGDWLERDLRTAAELGRSDAEGWLVRKDGSRFWVSVSLTPIREAGESVLGYAQVIRDLGDRVEQSRALRKL